MSYANRVSFHNHYTSDRRSGYDRADETAWMHRLMNGGVITVVERLTGFGWWDVETGYRSPCGQFWLAAGDQDIRDHLSDFDSEDGMCQWVIDRANVCNGGHTRNRYCAGTTAEQVLGKWATP